MTKKTDPKIENKHPFMENLENFTGKTVEVTDVFNNNYRGKCLGINKQHLNIVIEDSLDIIIIKNPQTIRRMKE